MIQLTLKFKDKTVREYVYQNQVVMIGRHPKNDIHIDNLAVSKRHARLLFENDEYKIEDLESTNGTFVNEKKITKLALRDEDVVSIGKHKLIVAIPQSSKEAEHSKTTGSKMDRTMELETKEHKEMLDRQKK